MFKKNKTQQLLHCPSTPFPPISISQDSIERECSGTYLQGLAEPWASYPLTWSGSPRDSPRLWVHINTNAR